MTQLEKVACVLYGHAMDIQSLAHACGMPEPSTRRVLGQGVYSKHFRRLSAGVYECKAKAKAIYYKHEDELVPCSTCGELGLEDTPCVHPECDSNVI